MPKIKFFLMFLVSCLLTLGLSISVQSLLAAWTPPSGSPPDNNLGRPIENTAPDPLSSAEIDRPLSVLGNLTVGSTLNPRNLGVSEVCNTNRTLCLPVNDIALKCERISYSSGNVPACAAGYWPASIMTTTGYLRSPNNPPDSGYLVCCQ